MTTKEASDGVVLGAGESTLGAVWEFLWRGQALRAASARPTLSAVCRERLRRSRLAAELGDRSIDAAEPLRAGPSLPLAMSLYREAAYWALAGRQDGTDFVGLSEVWAASESHLSRTGLTSAELAVVHNALVDKTFVDTADDSVEVMGREVAVCQKFVHALIDDPDVNSEDRIATALTQRWLRVGLSVLVFLGVAFGGKVVARRALQGPDLALGKPWRASSLGYQCHPESRECGGAQTDIFFHTKQERSPWVEFDLGTPRLLGHVEVENRSDCCPERAVPLVVEVSDRREHWREVARQSEAFRSWEATFPPERARYLRLRVDRSSMLHLVRVSVRPP